MENTYEYVRHPRVAEFRASKPVKTIDIRRLDHKNPFVRLNALRPVDHPHGGHDVSDLPLHHLGALRPALGHSPGPVLRHRVALEQLLAVGLVAHHRGTEHSGHGRGQAR